MLFQTLSGRLLLLTTLFVMMAAVLIFFPVMSRFRVDYLRDRLERGQIAAFALLANNGEMIDPKLESELLANAGVINIVLQRDRRRELVLSSPYIGPIDATFDLRTLEWPQDLIDVIGCFLAPPDRIIRVLGPPVLGGGMVIEVMLPEAPLRAELAARAIDSLVISLAVSLTTALLLFIAARRFITRPISRVAENMMRFQEKPEDPGNIIRPSSSLREIFEAEKALQDMQSRLIGALKQKERLAALGGAVARIAHDLRNMLTTAQLLADRIDMSRDPTVRRVAPKIVASLDRAVALCERSLAFGRAEEPQPELRRVLLRPFIDDICDSELLGVRDEAITIRNEVPAGLVAEADPDQLFRVLGNLIRNARQALEVAGGSGQIAVQAGKIEGQVEIIVADTGPGLPARALEHLFQPFGASSRPDGSGLGLAIAAELVKGHGGSLDLLDTSTAGTRFRIRLPLGGAPLPSTDTARISALHPGSMAAK